MNPWGAFVIGLLLGALAAFVWFGLTLRADAYREMENDK